MANKMQVFRYTLRDEEIVAPKGFDGRAWFLANAFKGICSNDCFECLRMAYDDAVVIFRKDKHMCTNMTMTLIYGRE